MIEPIPEDAGDIFLIRKDKAIERGMCGIRVRGVFGIHVWDRGGARPC